MTVPQLRKAFETLDMETRKILAKHPIDDSSVSEFSKVWKPLAPIYDAYSFKLLPIMGKFFAKDADSYQYLAESIRMHPDQETLKQMMLEAGLAKGDYYNLAAGVVALHKGWKA